MFFDTGLKYPDTCRHLIPTAIFTLLISIGGPCQPGYNVSNLWDYIERDDIARVITILKKGTDVLRYDEHGRTPLLYVCSKYQFWTGEYLSADSMLFMLAPDSQSICARDTGGVSALIIAVDRLNTTLAELLLKHGVDRNAQDNNGFSALHYAVANDDTAMVRILLSYGADPNLHDRGGKGLLHMVSSRAGWIPLLENYRSSMDLSYRNSEFANDANVLKLLIAAGARVNDPDSNGNTPLHYACMYNRLSGAQYLLAHGADVNARNKKGQTPCDLVTAQYYYYLKPILKRAHAECAGKKEPLNVPAPEKKVSIRLSGMAGGSTTPFMRVALVEGSDYCDNSSRFVPRFSLSYDLGSIAGFADLKLASLYGVSWYHVVADAVSLLIASGAHGLGEGIGLVYLTGVLWGPPLIANMSVDGGFEMAKLSVGWNTDLFLWKKSMLIFQPHVSIKVTPPFTLIEAGTAWEIRTDESRVKTPRLFVRIGFGQWDSILSVLF